MTEIRPYHSPIVGELDLHLIAEGRHERLYDLLGAHLIEHDGVPGGASWNGARPARATGPGTGSRPRRGEGDAAIGGGAGG